MLSIYWGEDRNLSYGNCTLPLTTLFSRLILSCFSFVLFVENCLVMTRDDTKEEKTYVGHTEGEFKTRYNGHTSSFRNSRYKHATELSKYVWHLKESSVKYSIKWRIMKKCKSYSNKTKRCNLCLHEKFLIIYYPKLSSLNSRNELLSKCRHRNKFLLSNK